MAVGICKYSLEAFQPVRRVLVLDPRPAASQLLLLLLLQPLLCSVLNLSQDKTPEDLSPQPFPADLLKRGNRAPPFLIKPCDPSLSSQRGLLEFRRSISCREREMRRPASPSSGKLVLETSWVAIDA